MDIPSNTDPTSGPYMCKTRHGQYSMLQPTAQQRQKRADSNAHKVSSVAEQQTQWHTESQGGATIQSYGIGFSIPF